MGNNNANYWDPYISDLEYFAHPNVSASDVIKALKGPSEFFYYLNRNSSPAASSSSALEFGSSFHEMVLEDAYTPTRHKHTKTTLEHLEQMKKRVYQVFPILSGSHPDNHKIRREQAGFAYHDDYDVYMKLKADVLLPDKKIMIDLKTTTDATPGSFKWSAKKYNYHIQAAHYLDCANRIDGEGSYDTFIFLTVEKTYPYKVFMHQCSEKILIEGLEIRDSILKQVSEWKSNRDSILMELLFEEQDKIYLLDW